MLKAILLVAFLLSLTSGQDYTNGGNNWSGTCSTGDRQSPINIQKQDVQCDKLMKLELQANSESVGAVTISKALTYSYTLTDTSLYFTNLYATDIDGNIVGYKSLSMQVHLPSEHQVDGKSYDVELQIIHDLNEDFSKKTYTYKKAIISIFFNQNDAGNNQFFQHYEESQTSFIMANALADIFDGTAKYYTYQGSLTQPPCTESVNWYVFPQALSISTSQYRQISQNYYGKLEFPNGNKRNIQSGNDRDIKEGHVQCEDKFIYFFTFFIIYIFMNFFIFKML